MQLVFATNNHNKIKEVQTLLPEKIKLLSLEEIGCFEDIPESQNTIKGNAIQKAEYIKTHYGYDCFADDTGLEIFALDGRPGVHSARYAGEQRDSEDNMNKVLMELESSSDRSAQFKTVITLYWEGVEHQFEGIVHGNIASIKTGSEGFGYDPIFIPEGETRSFAEMTLAEKNQFSHRARAIEKLVAFFNTLPNH